jgi:hypothetical protein
MEYREIVSVTGIGGLFQLVATKSDGAIVRNLADKTTKFIPARLHNVTPLESIEVYTTGDNVRLHEVFQMMKDQPEKSLPDAKKADNDTIKGYFKSIFPEFDEERVYVSDMKKMLKWFELLKENDLLNFESMKEEAEDNEQEEAGTKEPKAESKETEVAAEKKPRAKKSADEDAAEEGAEKPKKTARKKKTDDEAAAGEEKPAKKAAKKKKEEE